MKKVGGIEKSCDGVPCLRCVQIRGLIVYLPRGYISMLSTNACRKESRENGWNLVRQFGKLGKSSSFLDQKQN